MHNFSVLFFYTHLSFYTYCLPQHWRTDHRGLQVPHWYHGSHPATIFALSMALLLSLHAVVIVGQLFPQSGCHKHWEPFAEMGLCNTSQQGFAAHRNRALQHTAGFAAHRRLCNTSQHQTHTGWQHDTAEQKMGAMPNASRVRTGASPQRIREHPLRNKHSTEQKTHIQQQPLLAGAHHHRQDQSTNTHTLRNKHSTEHTHKGTSTAQNTHTDGQAQHKKSNYVQGSWTEKVSRAPSTGMD